MKYFAIAFAVCAAALMAFFGSGLVVAHAKLETIDGVKYLYLQNPTMLAASASKLFVVDGDELIVLDKAEYTETPVRVALGGFHPVEIGFAHGNLFLYDKVDVQIRNENNLSTVVKTISFTATSSAFHVAEVGPNFRIYNAARWEEYGADLEIVAFQPIDVPANVKILSITTAANGSIYYVGEAQARVRRIYENGREFDTTSPFNKLGGIAAVDNRLVFISSGLWLATVGTPPTYFEVSLAKDDVFSVEANNEPAYVCAYDKNQVYVIDAIKRSIDRYRIDEERKTLVFAEVVVASNGSDNGYHLGPNNICVLDENRYVVADEIGVKIIDKKINRYIPHFTKMQVDNVLWDGYEYLYLTQGATVHRFEVLSSSNIVARGVVPAATIAGLLGTKKNALNEDIIIEDDDVKAVSWDVDRVNGVIYYVAENHAIRSKVIPDYWKPTDYKHLDWTRGMVPYADAQSNLFVKTKSTAILYAYPNAIMAQTKLRNVGEKLRVISTKSRLYDKTTGAAACAEMDYAYVLYQSGAFTAPVAYYVSLNDVEVADASEYSTTDFSAGNIRALGLSDDLIFLAENNPMGAGGAWVGYSGRVLINNLEIFKYPVNADAGVIKVNNKAVKVKRNFGLVTGQATPGLVINRLIYTPDANGYTFFEVRLDANGVPRADGDFVGFFDTRYIMDAFAEPNKKPWSPNARIVLARDYNDGKGLQVYESIDGTPIEYEGEFLQNRQAVLVIGTLDKNQKYVKIQYYGYDQPLEGYVESAYVFHYGISALQIVGIIALGAAIGVGSFFTVRYLRRRKIGAEPQPLDQSTQPQN